MINIDFHTEKLSQDLALQRFFFHQDEVKRALLPILQEVYQVGYDRGAADYVNNTQKLTPDTPIADLSVVEQSPVLHANVEVLTHNPVEEEVQCEQSSADQPESSGSILSES